MNNSSSADLAAAFEKLNNSTVNASYVKLNKVHGKLKEKHAESDQANPLNHKHLLKLQALYRSTISQLQNNQQILEQTVATLQTQIQQQDAQDYIKNKKNNLQLHTTNYESTSSSSLSPTDSITTVAAFSKGQKAAVKPDSSDWILAHVVRHIASNIWEVEDAESDEENPGIKKKYKFPSAAILPILKHPQEHVPNKKVLALYPGSSCFYNAVVVATPRMVSLSKGSPDVNYIVKFEDDNNIERAVHEDYVLDPPVGL